MPLFVGHSPALYARRWASPLQTELTTCPSASLQLPTSPFEEGSSTPVASSPSFKWGILNFIAQKL